MTNPAFSLKTRIPRLKTGIKGDTIIENNVRKNLMEGQ